MKRHLNCPCGVHLEGADEDDLVDKALAHLSAEHPQLAYEREQILFMAY